MTKAANLVTSITVDIDSPAPAVREVLTDFPRYAEWNSFCVGLDTTGRLGDLVYMQVRILDKDTEIPVNEYLVAWEPEQLRGSCARPTTTRTPRAATSTSKPTAPIAAGMSRPTSSWASTPTRSCKATAPG